MIDLTVMPDRLERAVKRARERNIIVPTFKQMKNPALVPAKAKEGLKKVGLWDVNPLNLFRITWHNEPVASGGGFGGVNYLELPKALTGVRRPHHRAGGQMVPHRRAQGGGRLRLPGRQGWSPASSIRRHRKPSGLPPATTAAAVHTTQRCSAASPLPSCRKA